MSPAGDEQIDESIVVVVAGADSLAPAREGDVCFLGYIGKRAVVIVAIEAVPFEILVETRLAASLVATRRDSTQPLALATNRIPTQ